MKKNEGLENVIVTNTSISEIKDTSLFYRGYDINDLVENAIFEEVVYLLWNGKLPNEDELEGFKVELYNNMTLENEVMEILEKIPQNSDFSDVLRTMISVLSLYDEEIKERNLDSNLRKGVKIQAKISSLIAAIARKRKGLEIISPNKKLNFSENFLYMLHGDYPTNIEASIMNKALILHADHELNTSTFASRVAVSSLSDIYSGIVAAIGTLKGSLHGGANKKVITMLKEIGNEHLVYDWVYDALSVPNKKIMGFGHRVYKNGDARAKILKDMSREICDLVGKSYLYKISDKIEEIMEKEKGLKPNVDFYAASVYYCLGIENDMFTPIFALSRTSGWVAHILEQYETNRLIRPRGNYEGLRGLKYIPLYER